MEAPQSSIVIPGFGISTVHRDPWNNCWNQKPLGNQTSWM